MQKDMKIVCQSARKQEELILCVLYFLLKTS